MRNLIACLNLAAVLACGADRATITGKIVDAGGRPVEQATVLVWRAGVKTGYSAYCPSCYVDCGKRTVTDQTGSFTIKSLAPDLWFELLVVRDGYIPTFIKRVDPSRGPAKQQLSRDERMVDDPSRIVRGRVVERSGQPVRAAVVQAQGVYTAPANGLMYGTIEGLEPVAVTNPEGEFEIAYNKQAKGMLLRVEARAMASKMVAVPTGSERRTITRFPRAR